MSSCHPTTVGSPNRLLVALTLITQYCYSFCKRVFQYVKRALGSLSPLDAFNILCQVSSVILSYLAEINLTAIVKKLGGWVRLQGGVVVIVKPPNNAWKKLRYLEFMSPL